MLTTVDQVGLTVYYSEQHRNYSKRIKALTMITTATSKEVAIDVFTGHVSQSLTFSKENKSKAKFLNSPNNNI